MKPKSNKKRKNHSVDRIPGQLELAIDRSRKFSHNTGLAVAYDPSLFRKEGGRRNGEGNGGRKL